MNSKASGFQFSNGWEAKGLRRNEEPVIKYLDRYCTPYSLHDQTGQMSVG